MILRNLLVFGRLLRRLGIDVHVGRLIDVTEALQHVDLGSREEVYHTCRALLVHRHDQLALFDHAFDLFWRSRDVGSKVGPVLSDRPGASERTRPTGVERGLEPTRQPAGVQRQQDLDEVGDAESLAEDRIYSDAAILANRDFADYTPDEVALARVALDRLVWTPGERRTRRWIPGRGSRIDLRRALARSLRTGGDVVRLPRRKRRTRPRPLVLLCDISGSMERYSRMLLHFAHALTRRHRQVEAFLFSTQLTRVTVHLRTRRLGEALTAVSRSVPDWSGGTRIGGAIREFHQHWTRRTLRGGAVVLLISDGWDRGEPTVLRDQIARLQRSCHRLIWLNPLIGTTGYEPLTRGLQAALPFVDDFLPARTLTNLADLAVHLNALSEASRPRPFPLMDIAGCYTFNALPDRVWGLLMDPAVIASCIPGCDRLEPDGEDRYRATLTVALAAITGTYDGVVVISDKVPHRSYRLTVEGQGKPGFVKGSAAIELRAEGTTTIVDVSGTVQTGGPIARLGQRLIANVSKMMQDRFFACLQGKL